MDARCLHCVSCSDRSRPLRFFSPFLSPSFLDSDGLPGGLGPPLTCRGFESDDHVASFSNFALVTINEQEEEEEMKQTPNTAGAEHAIQRRQRMKPSESIRSHLLSAPGVCILSTIRGDEFGYFSGTSQSCPYVTGLLALEYGSGGVAGPCTRLPPLACMSRLVARSLAMERHAGFGFGFLPWPATRENQQGIIGTDTIIREVDVSRRHQRLQHDEEDSDSDSNESDGPMARVADTDTDTATDTTRVAPRNGNLTAPQRMRRYYGPIVIGQII